MSKERLWVRYLRRLEEWHTSPVVTSWEDCECAFWAWYRA